MVSAHHRILWLYYHTIHKFENKRTLRRLLSWTLLQRKITFLKKYQTSRSRWCAGNHGSLMLKWQKKNFVAAILDFWRSFLNQFWPNFVHAYKIHFWISFVLCVVLKCQYFGLIPEKLIFTHSKIVRLTRFFFYKFGTFQWIIFVLWVLSLSKNHEAKMSQNWIS